MLLWWRVRDGAALTEEWIMSNATKSGECQYVAPKISEIGKVGALVKGSTFGNMEDGGLNGSGKQVQTLQTFA